MFFFFFNSERRLASETAQRCAIAADAESLRRRCATLTSEVDALKAAVDRASDHAGEAATRAAMSDADARDAATDRDLARSEAMRVGDELAQTVEANRTLRRELEAAMDANRALRERTAAYRDEIERARLDERHGADEEIEASLAALDGLAAAATETEQDMLRRIAELEAERDDAWVAYRFFRL
jgi:chromosome segregation ATPase